MKPRNPGLAAFMEACGHDLCERCQCCDVITESCENCGGEGVDGHDCGEDCCACLYPEDNEPCDICDGRGYFEECLGRCDKDGNHKEEQRTFWHAGKKQRGDLDDYQ